jgi:glycerol-3-phosphate acyltransferase PlsY
MREAVLELIRPQNLLLYLFAYGLAAVPTSYVAARALGRFDFKPNKVANNTASFWWANKSRLAALLVLCLDLTKGLLPSAIALALDAPLHVIALVGLFAVLGHCFSIFLGLSGGHGGATCAGSLLVISYPAAIVVLLTNYLMITLTLSLGAASTISALVGTILIYFLIDNEIAWLIVAAMTAVILVRHWLSFKEGKDKP